jgi:hypothetical protein
MDTISPAKTPVHLWIVGVISLLWNFGGVYDYVMTEMGNADYLAMFTPEQRAYFENFPAWMVAFWALGVWGAFAGSILLLFRSRHAMMAFALSILGLAVNTVWQFGLSGIDIGKIFGGMPMIMTALVWASCIFLLWYATRQRAAGVLR